MSTRAARESRVGSERRDSDSGGLHHEAQGVVQPPAAGEYRVIVDSENLIRCAQAP